MDRTIAVDVVDMFACPPAAGASAAGTYATPMATRPRPEV